MAELRTIHSRLSRKPFKHIRPDPKPLTALEAKKQEIPNPRPSKELERVEETFVIDLKGTKRDESEEEKEKKKKEKEEEKKKKKKKEKEEEEKKKARPESTKGEKKETKKEDREKEKKKEAEESKTEENLDCAAEREHSMTKIAFLDPGSSFRLSERLDYMPHVILLLSLLLGTIFMFCSVGSSQWMEAEVNSLTVSYGLFERCVTDPASDVTVCQTFDWPGWLYGTSQEKMKGIKSLAIVSIFFASVFTLGALLLLLTSAYRPCQGGSIRKVALMVIDICLWLTVISAAVSSLLFVTGVDAVQAYPMSSVLWPPVLYCCGWNLCLLSRLVIAACCDVHRDGDSTVPFK